MADPNAKQKAFCEEYIIDFNGTQAAIRAGYSAKTADVQAAQLLGKLNIQKYIKELQEKRNKRVKITQDEVLEDLIEIKNRCMQACPVTFMGKPVRDKNGQPLWKFDAKGAARALEMIGKHIGFFLEDNKQKQPVIVPKEYILPNEVKDFEKHYKKAMET